MKTQVNPVAENEVQIEVEIPSEEVDRRFDQTLTRVARETTLPGFRKGRVPKQMVLQRFGADYVLGEALQDALPDWYEAALADAKVNVVSQPELDMDQLRRGEPYTFKATVQVKPEPKLGQYKGLEVPRRVVDVTDAQVDAQLALLQERFATLTPVEGRPVQEGDFITIDFSGRTEQGPLDGASGSDYALQVGSGRLVPGFEEALIGVAAEEEKEFSVVFPEDYQEESLRGVEVTFTATVKDVKQKVTPELNDEFAKDVSEFDTLAELRADVLERLTAAQTAAVEREYQAAVVEAVAEAASLEVPSAMIEREVDLLYHDFEQAVGEQGLTMEAYLSVVGKQPEQVREDLGPRAEANVRRRLVLEAVAAAEDLSVSDEDVRTRIKADAELIGRDGDQLVLDVYAAGRQEAVRDELLMARTVDFLVNEAVAVEAPAQAATSPAGADDEEGASA